MNIPETQATEILAKYGLKLAPAWEGAIPCWHRWHQHDVMICWMTTYEEYLKRIVQIYERKPSAEHAIRFSAFKPVQGKFPITKADADMKKANAELEKAYADLEKANADLEKANADLEKDNADWAKAYANWEKAAADWNRANADWKKENHDLILRYHKEECADVPFDHKTNSLILSK